MSRYTVLNKSISSHCCFEATVMDTTKPCMIGAEHYSDEDGNAYYESVCECMEEEDARRIADSLNKTEKRRAA